jgi:hypothetical protein
MTTNTPLTQPHPLQDRFGGQVAARLSAGTAELPYDITERLRAARTQAIAKRKVVNVRTAATVQASGAAATLTFGDEGLTFWNRIGSAIPLVALVLGLVLIHSVQNELRASEVAEVDAALLTDDLPPSAYADPGFAQFLKSGGE